MTYSPEKGAIALQNKLGIQPKLISLELSNSQGKRYGEGDKDALIIHSAWTHNVDRVSRGKGTHSSPQIQHDGSLVWFGETPALGEHQSIATLGKDKSELAAFLLRPLLLPSDNGGAHDGRLRIVMSHHSYFEPEVKARIESQVLGRHYFSRNGQPIDVFVESLELVPEGIGAYYLASELGQLKPGYSLTIEIGYRTTELWLVNEEGSILLGEPIQFGVYNLASAIANDDEVRRALLGSASTVNTVRDTQVAIALKQNRIAKMTQHQWESVKERHLNRWKDEVLGVVFSRQGDALAQTEQFLFSGGGAMLLREKLLDAGFWVDEDAQTASVRGSYYHFLSRA